MFTIRTPEGELQTVSSLDGYDGCEVVTEHDRAPEEHEEWDHAAGAWKINQLRKADTDFGAAHIDKAHSAKQLEAAMVLSGVTLTHGLLAEEAAALGVSVEEIAQAVHDRAAEFRASEVSRRTIKANARSGKTTGSSKPKPSVDAKG